MFTKMSLFVFENQNKIKFLLSMSMAVFFIIHGTSAMADGGAGYKVPGTDKSASLSDANDLAATLIGFSEKILAPTMAVACAITGVHRCAKKKHEEGVPLIIGAVGLVFIGRIMDTISKIFN